MHSAADQPVYIEAYGKSRTNAKLVSYSVSYGLFLPEKAVPNRSFL